MSCRKTAQSALVRCWVTFVRRCGNGPAGLANELAVCLVHAHHGCALHRKAGFRCPALFHGGYEGGARLRRDYPTDFAPGLEFVF